MLALVCYHEVVSRFKYFGNMIFSNNILAAEIDQGDADAGYAWHQLKVAKMWCTEGLEHARKVLLSWSIVLALLLYGGHEEWLALTQQLQHPKVLSQVQVNCLRPVVLTLGKIVRQL